MSLFDKCNYNVIFGKLCFKIHIPPPYLRKTWNYKKVDVENIQHIQNISIAVIDRYIFFQNITGDRKVQILNESLKNIFHNHISNEIIKCDNKQPPWIPQVIKNKLKKRSTLARTFQNCKTAINLIKLIKFVRNTQVLF